MCSGKVGRTGHTSNRSVHLSWPEREGRAGPPRPCHTTSFVPLCTGREAGELCPRNKGAHCAVAEAPLPAHSQLPHTCRGENTRSRRMGLGTAEEGRAAARRNWGGPGALRGLTIVLDDAFEVVGHQRAQGPLVGQPQAVGEHDGCVHHGAVDQLREQQRNRVISPLPKGQALLGIGHAAATFRSPLGLCAMLSAVSDPTSLAGGSGWMQDDSPGRVCAPGFPLLCQPHTCPQSPETSH